MKPFKSELLKKKPTRERFTARRVGWESDKYLPFPMRCQFWVEYCKSINTSQYDQCVELELMLCREFEC